jgi:hypothetical protein
MNQNDLIVTSEYGRSLRPAQANSTAFASGNVRLHGQKISWWRLFDLQPLPELPPDQLTALAALDRAVGDNSHFELSSGTLDSRVAGMLGHVARVLDTKTAYGYMLWRLRETGGAPLYQAADFSAYLGWKTVKVLEGTG